MYKLDNWKLVGNEFYLYTVPEDVWVYVTGRVYDHPDFIEGTRITTSRIIKVEGKFVTTSNDSTYELLEANPEYKEWCRIHEVHIPTEEEPISYKVSV